MECVNEFIPSTAGVDGRPVGVVHLDNHLLAVDKPSGLPSQPDASGDASLVDLAKDYVRRRFDKPGDVYLALLHRLDRPTSGLVLLARTDKAAGRMAEALRRRDVEKTYLALVERRSAAAGEATLLQYLVPAGNGGMRISPQKTAEAREAGLAYRTLAANGRRALLEVRLLTGVKHQIRCQLAAAGLPVVGDFRYGDRRGWPRPTPAGGGRAVLLHAWKLAFTHPVRREPMALRTPPPPHWSRALSDFAGSLPESLDA